MFGTDACFYVKPTAAPEVLLANMPLTWNLGKQALNVYRVSAFNHRYQHFWHGDIYRYRWDHAVLVGQSRSDCDSLVCIFYSNQQFVTTCASTSGA